jgi:NitT/TauT family transport system substrate-binding protein
MKMRQWLKLASLFLVLNQASAFAQDLALNWKPEPEFGGFYEALFKKYYEAAGLKINILPGGAGQPVTQMVAGKKVKFGIAAADEVILARAQGAKVVALFAVYQNNPQGFMVHPERKIKSLKELFQSDGTIALQKGLPYTVWIEKQYAPIKAKVVPYTGGITSFIQNPQFSQQCFIFSEPIAARREKLNPQTFLISESGFNTYLASVIVHEDTLKNEPAMVAKFIEATRKGWQTYLADSKRTNIEMQKMNPSLDLGTFNEAAKLQKPFIETDETNAKGLGLMTIERWKKLYEQMAEVKLVKSGLDASRFFKNISTTPVKSTAVKKK